MEGSSGSKAPDFFAEIGRHTALPAASFFIPCSPKQDEARCSRHEESEAIGVGAKSLSQAIVVVNVEDSVFSAPDPA
jgi:hypothetical protein